jgi:hypothetical protein
VSAKLLRGHVPAVGIVGINPMFQIGFAFTHDGSIVRVGCQPIALLPNK